jgi:ABC-type glycerol-3-phosphate transport system permease component
MKEKTREEYRQFLENQYNAGTLGLRAMTEALAQYDTAHATIRSTKYMLSSVIVASISAVASAISAAFSAYAVWPKK